MCTLQGESLSKLLCFRNGPKQEKNDDKMSSFYHTFIELHMCLEQNVRNKLNALVSLSIFFFRS